ncbi:MAG: aminomethyl-transferring glycine dehydrogenase subunit GcvPA [Gammaproteobacteria bacterium]|nr:aminomethyl-transferring glycine dehydrogenase subunit GcvPA [Gammaproteobacteria bacterium]
MPFIPHTHKDVENMFLAVRETGFSDLFDEIPSSIPKANLTNIPEGMNELATAQHMEAVANLHPKIKTYIGAGAYEHHIPAAVWDLVGRGEFMTAYTPYQAEASQGSLQLIYEFQSMMTALTKMDVSNASLYDGATALAEAVLMAIRAQKKSNNKRILMPQTVHPHYREAVKAIVHQQGIELVECPFDLTTGLIDHAALEQFAQESFSALVIPFPNFFGSLESVDKLTDWAHAREMLVIAVVNPMALGLLKAPGDWGIKGVDIVCGELQPFGMPLASGGPYAGFMCCRQELVRQMPGRIVGQTVDQDNKRGFVLTLQAREQHIRRSKATSNICTNQGLLVTAATIYMSLLGPQGLRATALKSHQNTQALLVLLKEIKVMPVFNSSNFHECVIRIPNAIEVAKQCAEKGVLIGLCLEPYYSELKDCILVCVTETKTDDDLRAYCAQVKGQLV